MGCCAEDACSSGLCPAGSLRQAVLSDDMKSASAFIVPKSDTLAVAPTTTTAATSQPTVTMAGVKDGPSESSGGLPRAAVAGIGLGTAALVLIIAVLIYWLVRKRKAAKSRKALARTLLDGDAPRKLRSEKSDGIPSFHAPLTLPKDIQSSLQMPGDSPYDSRARRGTTYHSQTQSFAESEDTFVGSPAPQYSSPQVPRYSMEKAPLSVAPVPPFMQNPAAQQQPPTTPTSLIPGMVLPNGPLPASTMQQSIAQQNIPMQQQQQQEPVPAFRQPGSYPHPMMQQAPVQQQQQQQHPADLENVPRPPHHLHPQNRMHPQGYARLPPNGQGPPQARGNPNQQQRFRNARPQQQKPLSPELPIVRRHSSLAFNPKALRFSPSGRLKAAVSERLEKHREADRQKEYEKLQASEQQLQNGPPTPGPSTAYYSDLRSPRNMPMEGIIEDSESIMTYNSREPTHWEAVERR